MTTSLFEPVTLGPLELANRIAMAPMTRARSTQPGNVPNEMMATYYAQRAAAGLIVSEATQISRSGSNLTHPPCRINSARVMPEASVVSSRGSAAAGNKPA